MAFIGQRVLAAYSTAISRSREEGKLNVCLIIKVCICGVELEKVNATSPQSLIINPCSHL